MTVEEDEYTQLKSNAENLATCLHALLERIEKLEVKQTTPLAELAEPVDQHVRDNGAAKKKRGKKRGKEHSESSNGGARGVGRHDSEEPENSEQVLMSDTVAVDPETGLKKRTIVTERVLTTKTFHALALDSAPALLPLPGRQPIVFESRGVDVEAAQLKQIELENISGLIVVTKVNPEATHGIRPGDAVTEVDGHPVTCKADVEKINKRAKLTLTVAPPYNAPSIFYRLHSDYNCQKDDKRMCHWLPIDVRKGEVVQVLSKDDNWMLARKVHDLNAVGYIPQSLHMEKVSFMSPFGRRVLVLVGASGVGRRTLKSMLLRYAPSLFSTVVPLTSRAPRGNEVDGREYHFVRKEDMLKRIRDGDMIEWGELDGHLYGTSADAVRDIMHGGRMCVLDTAPRALSYLYNGEFMPFVVHISPPQLDEFTQLEGLRPSKRSAEQPKRAPRAKKIANGPLAEQIHLTLINRNMDVTLRRLIDALEALRNDVQWVPVSWMC
ncbi:unnamed protein product, partial [Mesorhabditis spiculigera]